MNLRQRLYAWRENEAAKRGVELFRILPNNTLEEIVKILPHTKEELTAIKGIKEAKWREYGRAILEMVQQTQQNRINKPNISGSTPDLTQDTDPNTLSVSSYLDIANAQLARVTARVQGEIVQWKAQGSAMYATLKDKEDDSVLSVFMWLSDLALSGIEPAEGLEVIVEGRGEVYKPSGRFSFRAHSIELVGEGALKKAYDTLKKKLDTEGLFATERKRSLPDFAEKIGLVTSKQGAVIHDFLNNLGKYGFKIRFTDARVEGAAAVRSILAALSYWHTQDIDVLVVVRGGGSLESLQAFNNEAVVRAIAEFPMPTIVAIGHDKDVPLAQLAADLAPSTPTAATVLLNRSWEEGVFTMQTFSKDIVLRLNDELWLKKDELRAAGETLSTAFAQISGIFNKTAVKFISTEIVLERHIGKAAETLRRYNAAICTTYEQALRDIAREFNENVRTLRAHNPLEQLKLGYSLLSKNGKIVRSIADLQPGTDFEARLADGSISATVNGK